MIDTLFKKAACTVLVSVLLLACKPQAEDSGEERDKGKVFIANTAINVSRKPSTITFKFKPLGIKPDCVITSLIDMRVMLRVNSTYIRNVPMAINGSERYTAYNPGTLNIGV